MKKNLISVIVPAYKQEKTIKKDLENINQVLKDGLQDIDFEIICVVDGYLDNTLKEAKKVKSTRIQIVGYQHNKGKGYAVRFGMARARGELVSFLDAGMDIGPSGIMMLMAHMKWYDADIIVGSKRHAASKVNYPLLRHVLSIGYTLLIRILFSLSLTDTQSGLKIFKRQVLEKVLPRLLVKEFAMDIEMLAVARKLGFERIYEAPIEVTFDKRTSGVSTSVLKVALRMLQDTLAIFYRLNILGYYNDGNERKWKFEPELNFRVNVG